MAQTRTVIIGISGCSSSGKTTLARLLRDIFPETFILHEDDFYKPESELPIKHGLADWDCPEAISIPDLEAALTHVRATGTFPVSSRVPTTSPCTLSRRSNHGCTSFTSPTPLSPPLTPLPPSSSSPPSTTTRSTQLTKTPTRNSPQPTVNSIEDLNSVGPCPATPQQIASCTATVQTWLAPNNPGSLIFPPPSSSTKKKTRICILDGFLLYAPQTSSPPTPLSRIPPLLDIKLFLQASKAKALHRRGARDGYVHVDGFWTDPPGYVEKIVWPNYVEAHRWLFEGGDVEGGRVDQEVLGREGILVPCVNGEEVEFGGMLEWAVGAVMGELERICLGEGRDGGKGE
ncbi:nicotinamide riboside kinase [Parachaetomium inaequale]|uniref:Nicotinamide riboside kinase n=1 Tax=Parachaetomium inaequale TaxID=2588326 RepID=A0AAN6SU33_9PEZI|nr:nicotinamide riboside kinase [Parachaetomium inaequale]